MTNNITKVKSDGLYVGGSRILNTSQMNQAAHTLRMPVNALGGLALNSPQRIIAGKDIGYRPENQSISVIGGKRGGQIPMATPLAPGTFIPGTLPRAIPVAQPLFPPPPPPPRSIHHHHHPYHSLSFGDLVPELSRAAMYRNLDRRLARRPSWMRRSTKRKSTKRRKSKRRKRTKSKRRRKSRR